jgi:hypothetical protein
MLEVVIKRKEAIHAKRTEMLPTVCIVASPVRSASMLVLAMTDKLRFAAPRSAIFTIKFFMAAPKK